MRLRLGAILASVLTISFGVVVILGLLLPDDLEAYTDFRDVAGDIALVMVQLVTITIAMTILLGILNLISVHLSRIFRRGAGRSAGRMSMLYSLVLLASFGGVVGSYASDRETSMILLEKVQFAVESALAGLLLFALVYGAYRLMWDRVSWSNMLFVVAVLIVLLGALPLANTEVVQDVRDWLITTPVSAGARGILLGIALATLVTGVRVIIGVDRSYRE